MVTADHTFGPSSILHTITAVRSYMDRNRLTLCQFNLQLAHNGLNARWLIIYIGKIETHFVSVIIAWAIFVSLSCCLGSNYIVSFLEGPERICIVSV